MKQKTNSFWSILLPLFVCLFGGNPSWATSQTSPSAVEAYRQGVATQMIQMETEIPIGQVVRLEYEAEGNVLIAGLTFDHDEEDPIFGGKRHYYKITNSSIILKGKITYLSCVGMKLNKLDLSKAGSLKSVSCAYNNLTLLDVSACPDLLNLACANNQIKALDCSNNSMLDSLDCSGNELETLKIAPAGRISVLACNSNKLKTLKTSDLVHLKELYCSENDIAELNVKNNKELIALSCYQNKFTTLDVTGLDKLQRLTCSVNNLGRCEVVLKSLVELYAEKCALNQLKLSCPNLELLACADNQLTELDLSNCPKLNTLSCWGNQLSALDLSHNPKMEYLWTQENKLTQLNLSGCADIFAITCHGNQIAENAMTKIINDLPRREPIDQAYFMVVNTANKDEKNYCTEEHVRKAKEKGWGVYDNDGGQTPHPGKPYQGINGVQDPARQAELTLAPNPAVDYAIVTGVPAGAPVELFNMAGQLLWRGECQAEKECVIDTRSLAPGIYIVRVHGQSLRLMVHSRN